MPLGGEKKINKKIVTYVANCISQFIIVVPSILPDATEK